MILKTLKSNNSINLLIFPIVGILFWLKSLLEPYSYPFFAGESENILFSPIHELLKGSDFLNVLIALILIILIGLLVQFVNDSYAFIRVRTKLPAVLFIIIISGFTKLHTLHPVYLAAVFLLLAIHSLFGTFEQSKPYSNIFNAGFLIGVGSLFYFNLIILFPAFFVGIRILSKENNWRGYVILLMGFLVPLFFAFSYAVLNDQALEMLKIFEENIITPANHFRDNIVLHGFLSFLILLTLIGSVKILQQYDSKKVSTRKYFTIFFLLFILSILSFSLIPASNHEILILTAIPVTYLISNFFVFFKSRFWSELLFILLVGIVIFMQFSDKFMLNG